MPNLFSRAAEIFARAHLLCGPERELLLAAACGADAELRAEVDRLLRGAQAPLTFARLRAEVRSVEDRVANAAREQDLDVGSRVGAYRLLEQIGEGGFGVVYLAEQEAPVRRRVALKVLKHGMDTRQVVARFEAERQALALMDHPNIARVFDGGATEGGRPYFVMELVVRGVPITRFCDQHRLTPRQRLELFQDVCRAVQHAHMKGIIHRDLKPSNVLLTLPGGERYTSPEAAMPKVIDFGIAKATEQPLTDRTLFTERHQVLGTPAYMSPEQTQPAGLDIDTRSDIYSLGVMLYELLTGTTPIESGRLKSSDYEQMVRLIRGEDPPRPSTRIIRSPVDAASARGASTQSLAKMLRGDLDWIVMRCLEKERTRRYQTVHDLETDIVRFLGSEPVLAAPPSTTYLVRKFARRHRFGVGAVAAIIIVLLLGIATTTAQMKVANDRYQEIVRLADVKRLADLSAREDQLWPELPEQVPAMEAWLDDARKIVRHLDDHRRTLDAWRKDGVCEGVQWRFRTDELQWRHEVLAGLVRTIEEFANPDPRIGLISGIAKRIQVAREVETVSLVAHAPDWERAIASIASVQQCPHYHGLKITPQIGLVPIGRDAHSGLWEFWHPRTGAEPKAAPNHAITVTEGTGLVFVLIPAQTFWMGAQAADPDQPNYDPDATATESAPRQSTLPPYFLAKHEMTQGQWLRAMGGNPSFFKNDAHSLAHPVECVSWEECSHALARLGLALPTDAEWECAARAGTQTPWWTGSARESLQPAANLADQYLRRHGGLDNWGYESWDDGHGGPAPVGQFLANGFGLHDVHGNVAEWCQEWLGVNPGGPDGSTLRLVRGGSWRYDVVEARSSRRYGRAPDERSNYIGLRPCRRLTP